MPNLFARQTALTNVGGRIDYISNPKRQEHILAYCDGAADALGGAYWRILAQECKDASKHTTAGRKTVQGRELIIQLSNALLDRMTPDEIAGTLAASFEQKYNRPCAVALHWNKKKTNLHAHLIYAERQLLEEPTVKIAPRALFFDEDGKRCYKKKEVLDDNGELRHGCKIIAKGEEYERRCFGAVDPSFSRHGWLKSAKTNWLLPLRNGELRGDVEITEYSKASGKLPQQHMGKVQHVSSPEAADAAKRIEKYNDEVKEYNRLVDLQQVPAAVAADIQGKVESAKEKNDVLHPLIQRLKEIIQVALIRQKEKMMRKQGLDAQISRAKNRVEDRGHIQPKKEEHDL